MIFKFYILTFSEKNGRVKCNFSSRALWFTPLLLAHKAFDTWSNISVSYLI